MIVPIEFFNWWIVDERTGERRLTSYKLSRADAQRAFRGAEPEVLTREVRNLRDPIGPPATSRPGESWSERDSRPLVSAYRAQRSNMFKLCRADSLEHFQVPS